MFYVFIFDSRDISAQFSHHSCMYFLAASNSYAAALQALHFKTTHILQPRWVVWSPSDTRSSKYLPSQIVSLLSLFFSSHLLSPLNHSHSSFPLCSFPGFLSKCFLSRLITGTSHRHLFVKMLAYIYFEYLI